MKNSLKSVRLDDELLLRLKPVMKRKKANFTQLVSEALRTYLRADEFHEAIEAGRGAWKDKNHPESTDAYIRRMRKGRKF